MKKTLKYFLLLFFLPLFLIFSVEAKASNDIVSDSLQNVLDRSRKQDDLESWSYLWTSIINVSSGAEMSYLNLPLQRVWRKPATNKEQKAWFYLLINIGYSALQQGDIILSTDVYEQAWRFFHEVNSISSAQALEYVFKPLGNNYTRLGDYERALFIQKEGLEIAQQLEDKMQQASLLNNLAITVRWNGQLSKALNYCEDGLQNVQRKTPLEGLLYSTNADILFEMDRMKEAEKNIDQSIYLFNHLSLDGNPNAPYWLGSALQVSARIQLELKHYAAALGENKKALNLFKRYFPRTRQREKAKIYVTFGDIALLQQKTSEAITFFNHSLQILIPSFSIENPNALPREEQFYAENTFLDALDGKGRALHIEKKDSLALLCYRLSASVVQKLRKSIFSKEAKTLLQQRNLQTANEAIAIAHDLYQPSQETHFAKIALSFVEQYKAQLLLDELTNNRNALAKDQKDSLLIRDRRLQQAISFYKQQLIEATLDHNQVDSLRWKQRLEELQYQHSLLLPEIKEEYPGWYEPVQYNVQRIDRLIEQIPEQTIVWEFFDGPNSWYAFALDRHGVRSFQYLGKADALHGKVVRFVRNWFTQGPAAMSNRPDQYFQEARFLFKLLADRLPLSSSHLIVIPGGVLGRLPFEALITGGDYSPSPGQWQYLLRSTSLSEAYSLSVFQQSQKSFLQSGGLKGFAGFFISPTDSATQALSGVQEEVRNIRKFINGHFYENKTATSAHLLKSLAQAEVIHISTHAFLLGGQKIPALQMADEKIYLTSLSGRRVHPSLIFLGACQSANGLLSTSEGIISLARKFTAVGAGGVIAGLWNLNDEVTAKLTGLFYKFLKKNNHKALSLQQAKLFWLNDKQVSADKKLPYYWAGLVYFGNMQPLQNDLEQPQNENLLIFAIIGIAVLVMLSIFLGRKYL